jgi:predicted RNase H-related nuclease YkuK (DUF458 family)
MDNGWKVLTGKPIESMKGELQSLIEREIEDDVFDLEILVGCDSQLKKGKITYVTAIVVHRKRKVGGGGSGGRVFYKLENEKYPKGQFIQPKRRLWNETYKSVETALWLDDFLIDYAMEVDCIHADLNQDKKYLSNEVVGLCLGYIKGMGFYGKIKPDSFVASKIADKMTK